MSHQFEHREYLIIPVSELTKVNFDEVLETSAETVRKSIDQTKTFVKWDGETPAFVATISGAEGPYTYSEILDVLTGVEWTSTGLYP
jgi:hypothetical protein